MSPVTPVLALLLFCVISYLLYKNWRKNTKNFPPGPPRLPLIGSYLHMLWLDYDRPHVAIQRMSQHYDSPWISLGFGPYNCVIANDYETCREVFTNPKTQGRSDNYTANLRTFGKPIGIFNEDGEEWLQIKRKTLRSMRDFGFGRRSPAFEDVGAEEVGMLIERLMASKEQAVIVNDNLFPTLFNMINHLVHGLRTSKDDLSLMQRIGRASWNIATGTDVTGRMVAIFPFLCHTFFPNLSGANYMIHNSDVVHTFIRESFKEHQHHFDEQVLRDMVSVFIKDQKTSRRSEEQMYATCMDLVFPNATVTINMTWALAFLTERPKLLQKCQKQLDDVVGRGRLPTLDDRQNLPLIEATIRETLRLGGEIALGVPHRATEDMTLGGYFVPKDTTIFTNLYAMNRDPKIYTDPHEFRPERFIEGKDRTLPFGLGKRVCAGETFARQNMFLVLAGIIQNFNLEFGTGLNPDKYRHGAAIAPNDDLTIRFLPRP